MATFVNCTVCSGFVPAFASVCPHCDSAPAPQAPPERSRWSRLGRRLLRAAGGGAVAVTLMACYGAAVQRMPAPAPVSQCQGGVDADRDGACTPADCDDRDRNVHANAQDPAGDGIDQNCDGIDGVAQPGALKPVPGPTPAEPPPDPGTERQPLAPVGSAP